MKKKKFNYIKVIILIFLLIFTTIYFSCLTGYYEYQNSQKTSLTKEQIIKFENDIKTGKEIDISEYVISDDINYNNKLSKLASEVSEKISYIIELSVSKTFKFLSKLIDE